LNEPRSTTHDRTPELRARNLAWAAGSCPQPFWGAAAGAVPGLPLHFTVPPGRLFALRENRRAWDCRVKKGLASLI